MLSDVQYSKFKVRYSHVMTRGKKEEYHAAAGLCADCLHARRIESDRGSAFYLCQLSATDPHFRKYPHLPVFQCSGHTPVLPAK
jgi:hypothetical protein